MNKDEANRAGRDQDPSTKLAVSIPEAASLVGLSHVSIYKEIEAGRLATFRVGRRRLISRGALDRWVSAMEAKANA